MAPGGGSCRLQPDKNGPRGPSATSMIALGRSGSQRPECSGPSDKVAPVVGAAHGTAPLPAAARAGRCSVDQSAPSGRAVAPDHRDTKLLEVDRQDSTDEIDAGAGVGSERPCLRNRGRVLRDRGMARSARSRGIGFDSCEAGPQVDVN